MPPAPPVTKTISLDQSYSSLTQLLRTFSDTQPLSHRAIDSQKSVLRRPVAEGWRIERFSPFLVKRARSTRGSRKAGFKAVWRMSRTRTSAQKPSRGIRPWCIGMLAIGLRQSVLWWTVLGIRVSDVAKINVSEADVGCY